MTNELHTRCPYCRTTFRVSPQQLAARQGQVRCGHCRQVFNGQKHLQDLSPSVIGRRSRSIDEEALQGPPTITLRQPVKARPTEAGDILDQHAMAEASFAWQKKDPQKRKGWYVFLFLLLLLSLMAQATYYFRHQLAAYWPAIKPTLEELCAPLGCRIEPIHEIEQLKLVGHELQYDPAHRGLLIFTGTLRNYAQHPLAAPQLELTLLNSQGQTVVRRVFTPAEYLSDPGVQQTGIAANQEALIKFFIDGSKIVNEGFANYHPELFYN